MQNKDVWQLIKEKLPVSISLGLWTFLISYLISIPLGVAKAVREGTRFDAVTTLVVLLGYAIPGFVLGVLLIVLFAGGTFFDWFPLRGLTSDNWDELSLAARIRDYFWHLALPLTCLVIGSFAVVTMLTKNTFVEEMRKQYVLVARAKGLSPARVLYKHIFRNALIPLVTGFPAAFIGAFFAGVGADRDAVLARRPGAAGATRSVVRRDYPVVLGSLYLFTLIALVVKLVSDLLYVVVDPRVQFASVGRVKSGSAAMSAVLDSDRPPDVDAGAGGRSAARPLSPNQRAWARFKRNRLGLRVAVDLRSRCWCWRRSPNWSATTARCVARIDGQWYAPIFSNPSESGVGGDFDTPTDWKDPFIADLLAKPGNWALFTLNPHSADLARLLPTELRAVAAERAQLARHRPAWAATWWRGCSTASASASGSRSR